MMDTPGWLTFAQQASLPTLAVSFFLYAVTKFITILPQLRAAEHASDKSLRTDLMNRVTELENEVRSLRKALDSERIAHAAEVLDMQHDLGNEAMALDAFILLVEANPDKAEEQIPKIKALRETHRERAAIKRGAREAALISTLQSSDPPLQAQAA